MRKVLVDPAALEEAAKWLEIHSSSSGSAEAFAADALRKAIAQPAEAEGVDRWNGLKLAAEVAEEDGPWDPRVGLTDCEAAFAKSASPAVVLELIAALAAVTAERDRLESMLIRTATRHFALQIQDRADDKKLDECLSEGIAMLEAERDRLRDQVKVLQSDANSWQSGYDRGRHDGTKHRQSEVGQLRAEAEALRKDAELYRQLRDLAASQLGLPGVPCVAAPEGPKAGRYVSGPDLDAAMAAKEA